MKLELVRPKANVTRNVCHILAVVWPGGHLNEISLLFALSSPIPSILTLQVMQCQLVHKEQQKTNTISSVLARNDRCIAVLRQLILG